jgi:hypothetical protein
MGLHCEGGEKRFIIKCVGVVACHKLIRREELGEAWCLMSIEIRNQGEKGFGMVCW